MTVYADLVFIVNFIMDSFILWIVSKTSAKKTRLVWLAGGGLLMALMYCLLIFTTAFRFINLFAASAVILAAGIGATFRPKAWRIFFRMWLTAYGIAFMVGGLGMVLFYLTDLPYAAYYLSADPASFMRGVSWKLPLLCVGLSYLLIKVVLRVMERITVKRQTLCPVSIFFNARNITFQALLDTGHSLREPLSQAPVIVAEFEQVKPLLPDALKLLFYEKKENSLTSLINTREDSFYSRIRMIPFSSLGRANGMLLGFRPDHVTVSLRQRETLRDDVVIGIYNSRLTRDGRYHGLLSPEVITAAAGQELESA